jgi:hypothetical protein
MNKGRKNIFYTIAGCLFFLALPLIVSTRPPEEPAFLFTLPVFREMITNAVILVFFFINYDYFIPHLYFNRKYLAYGACILFCLLCICLIPILLTGDIRPGGNRPPPEMVFQEAGSAGAARSGRGPRADG